jgi:hypothetical protein
MDKLKGVQYRRVVSGHSEPCLKSVGHMTKELLIFKYKKFVLCLHSLIQLGIQNSAHISTCLLAFQS